ncbi:MAG TPA: hypothetical protein VE779_02610, partial [Candidatus Angelobacter sp.]|nr:hypothetical protein [Candidatus Angelobacter sp.]
MKRVLLLATLVLAALPVLAQESAPKPPAPPRHFYKLTYVLKEFDEGKVVNQRDFVLTVSTGERYASRMRAGSRIPVGQPDKFSYVDLGINLDTHLEDLPEGLALEVTADISSPTTELPANSVSPAIRQMRTTALALIAMSKPTTLFNIDDPAS